MFLLLLTQYWCSWLIFGSPNSLLDVMFMFAFFIFGNQLWTAKIP